MINRVLIRVKVVQMLYSYLLTKDDVTLRSAKDNLNKSLEKSQELYYSLISMMIDLTHMQEQRIDYAKNKYLPTDEDLNPNLRFVENELISLLENCEEYQDYQSSHLISWKDEVGMHLILDKIISSDIYKEYMALPVTDLKTDAAFWCDILKKVIFEDENFGDFLESKSVFWNDDLFIIGTFLVKTLKRWGEGKERQLLPMFKDAEDAKFPTQLFDDVVKNESKYNGYIDMFVNTKSWDADRVAFMDRVILQTAISEYLNFPKIPSTVTLNEYIEIAKQYSSSKSGVFVNGILDAVIKYLKKEYKLVKE